jgi:2-(1,2-epoxy-1,2-dihydrophenyl)acetyl-CoA isomerase
MAKKEDKMSENTVLVNKQDKVCTLTINRPYIKNAWTLEFVEELRGAFGDVGRDKEIHVVVLEGAGRDFSSGADYALFKAELTAPVWLDGMRILKDLILAIRGIPQPVIAKVRGVAIGGGINLALAADFVVAAEDARLCENFSNIGIIVDAGGNYFLPRLVGLAKARELAYLGDILSGKEAADMGLIYKAVPEAGLDAAVDALAQRLAGKSLEVMALIKEALDTSFEMSLQKTLEWEAAHQSIMTQTEGLKTAVNLYLASRKRK